MKARIKKNGVLEESEGPMSRPIRVAHILRKYDPSQWGGVETAILELLRGLVRHDVEGIVFAPRLPSHAPGFSVSDPIQEAGFEVVRYSAHLPAVGISKAERKRLTAVGGNLLSFSLPYKLARVRADILHTHTFNRIGGIARAVARTRRIPYVVSIHGGYLDLPREIEAKMKVGASGGHDLGRFFGMLVGSRRVVESAAAVFTVNPREAELLSTKYPELRVEKMPLGVDTKRFTHDHRPSAIAAFPFLCGRKLILSAGRIDPIKNPAFLVEQMSKVLRRVPEAILVLVGGVTDSDYGAALRETIERRGLSESVHLLEPLPAGSELLTGLYQQARVFALASRSETFGLVLVESVLAGTDFVASRTSGAIQARRALGVGQLFELGDDGAETYLDAVVEVLEGEPWNLAEARRLHQLAAEDFDFAEVAGRYASAYRELL